MEIDCADRVLTFYWTKHWISLLQNWIQSRIVADNVKKKILLKSNLKHTIDAYIVVLKQELNTPNCKTIHTLNYSYMITSPAHHIYEKLIACQKLFEPKTETYNLWFVFLVHLEYFHRINFPHTCPISTCCIFFSLRASMELGRRRI
jgi:hypothetical protein